MVSTFVWTKAVAVLKKQIASLGMEFVGEMLSRTDLDEDSDPALQLRTTKPLRLRKILGLLVARRLSG